MQNCSSQKHRPYIELMSPRLSQRRVVMPVVMDTLPQCSTSSSFGENVLFAKQQPRMFVEESSSVASRQFRRASSPLTVSMNRQPYMPRPKIWVPRNAEGFNESINFTPISLPNDAPIIYNTNSLPRMNKCQKDSIIMPTKTTVSEATNETLNKKYFLV